MQVMRTPMSPPDIAGPAPPPGLAFPPAERDARLTEEEYAAWLLPPQPRGGIEKAVQALSLAAGVIALTGGFAALWWII